MREVVFPMEEHANWLYNAKQSAIKTYKQVALYKLNMVYLYMHK